MSAAVGEAPELSAAKAIGGTIAFGVLGMLLTMLFFVGWSLLGALPIATTAAAVRPADVLAQALATTVGFGLATWVIGRVALGLGWAELRWAPPPAAIGGFGRGLLLGAAPAVLALVLAVVVGRAAWVADAGGPAAYAAQVGKTLFVLAPAAFGEELMFRGVALVALAAAFGRVAAVTTLALVFGVAHLGNPGVTPLAVLNIALAGVLLSVAFFLPGGIWTAFGAHLGWNGALAALDAPVSGLPFRIPLLDYQAGGPVWLTGGSFGPEGGLLATSTVVLAIVVAARWARKGLS